MDWLQWLLPAALVAGMLWMHRAGGGGCCGTHGHGGAHGHERDRQDRKNKEDGADDGAEAPLGRDARGGVKEGAPPR